ncbi:hypothetical protein [Flavobacterium faecale]|uniref:hypothetical protein n=1 Tax=Flavobacterium faecale TaxID=1355330 RepID=UPI003AAC6689
MRKDQLHVKIFPSIFYPLLFLFLGTYTANAQSVKTDSTSHKKYVSVDVPKTYERIIAKGYESLEMFDYLGNYYYKVNDLEKSKTYFDMLFKRYSRSQISKKSIEIYNIIIELEKSKKFISALD